MRYVFTSQETNGAFDLIERVVSPNFESPPVANGHTKEDFLYYLLEGRLIFRLDSEEVELKTGASLFVPRGVFFRWWNPDPIAARVLALYTPGGFGEYFREVISHAAKRTDKVHDYGATLTAVMALHAKYGMKEESKWRDRLRNDPA
nr:cupin domain-containing protein [Microvirga terricola]